jgi:hypothetical protein
MQHLGRRVLVAVLSIWLVIASLPVGATTTQAGRGLSKTAHVAASPAWDDVQQFRIEPQQANPEYVNYGSYYPDVVPVWTFTDGSGHILPQFIDNAFGVKGLEQWQRPSSSSPLDGLPAIGINATATVQKVYGITWPPNVIRVHPSATTEAVITWTSAFTSTTSPVISEQLTDLDPTCGSGITWLVLYSTLSSPQSKILAMGTLLNGHSESYRRYIPIILQGDTISLKIRALNGDPSCDSTGVQFTIG